MSVDSTLLLIAPEHAAIAEADRLAVADLAALSVGDVFADKKELATAYLTAHMLTIAGRSGSAGSIQSVKEGDLSLSYSKGEGSEDSLSATSYGCEFKRLRRSSVMSARTRMVS